MRRCTKCGTTYTDESLRFCLTDGTPLELPDEQVTVLHGNAPDTMPFTRGDQMRVDIPQSVPQAPFVPAAAVQQSSGPSIGKILLVVGLFVSLIVIGIVGAGALIYFNKDTRTAAVNENSNSAKTSNSGTSPSPTGTPGPTEDPTEVLREQIANLEKRLNEQKKSGQLSNVPLTMPEIKTTTTTTARVNSPGDGFLALRTLPNSEAGQRIMKIPHGAVISVGACGPVVRPVQRVGRWCQASYNGQKGWVFDAYLVY